MWSFGGRSCYVRNAWRLRKIDAVASTQHANAVLGHNIFIAIRPSINQCNLFSFMCFLFYYCRNFGIISCHAMTPTTIKQNNTNGSKISNNFLPMRTRLSLFILMLLRVLKKFIHDSSLKVWAWTIITVHLNLLSTMTRLDRKISNNRNFYSNSSLAVYIIIFYLSE